MVILIHYIRITNSLNKESIKLSPLDSADPMYELIKNLVNCTQRANTITFKDIYSIDSPPPNEYKRTKNCKLLCYGAPLACIAGILSEGFFMPSKELHQGFYFTEFVSGSYLRCLQFTDTKEYTTGVLLIAEVSLGDMIELQSFPQTQQNTTVCFKPFKFGFSEQDVYNFENVTFGSGKPVLNDQNAVVEEPSYIVYNANQILPRYLVTFTHL